MKNELLNNFKKQIMSDSEAIFFCYYINNHITGYQDDVSTFGIQCFISRERAITVVRKKISSFSLPVKPYTFILRNITLKTETFYEKPYRLL